MAQTRRRKLTKQNTSLAGSAAVSAHAYKRMARMTLMGLIVPKLIEVAKIPRPWTLGTRGATIQAGSGSASGGTQAAHNLPRDLTLNGRSIWDYTTKSEVSKAHPRIRMQFFYSPAATMTVPRESNYIDSRWEESAMPANWLAYLNICVSTLGGHGARGSLDTRIWSAALDFKQTCKTTLAETINRILNSDYYPAHEAILDNYFDLYEAAVERYDPGRGLEDLWMVYQLDKYR